MRVVAPDGRVGEEDGAAAVGLEAVLVRVDHHRVRLGDRAEVAGGGPEVGVVVGQEAEEAAVRGIDVDAGAVGAAERDRVREGVDGAQTRRGGREHDGADGAGRQRILQRPEVDPPGVVAGHDGAVEAEHVGHPAVRVVALRADRDAAPARLLARHEQRLQVGDRPAAGQVPQWRLEPDHPCEIGDHLLLHLARRRAAVERVVVGVDARRDGVGRQCHRVRRLEHLPGVARVAERVHARPLSSRGRRHPPQVLLHRFPEAGGVDGHRRVRVGRAEARVPGVEGGEAVADQAQRIGDGPAHAATGTASGVAPGVSSRRLVVSTRPTTPAMMKPIEMICDCGSPNAASGLTRMNSIRKRSAPANTA